MFPTQTPSPGIPLFPIHQELLKAQLTLTNTFSIFVLKTAKSLFLNFLNPNWTQIACLAGEKTFEYFIQPEKRSMCNRIF